MIKLLNTLLKIKYILGKSFNKILYHDLLIENIDLICINYIQNKNCNVLKSVRLKFCHEKPFGPKGLLSCQ